jgi:tRNA pseudouridine13 synthase
MLGCCIRKELADFVVEEIPSYRPSGTGEHAWLWIEKRGLSSGELVQRICSALGVASTDVGLAGQKDRHAVTRQFVSIPRRFASRAPELIGDDLCVLETTFHKNKLKTGHLRGNRFRLRLQPFADAFTAADALSVNQSLTGLAEAGFANYFGRQRFGIEGRTIDDGLRFLRDRLPVGYWPEDQSRTLRRLALSAVQSAVFNLVLARRIDSGMFPQAMAGDIVIRRNGIKPFLLPESADLEALIPTGPLPGPEMLSPSGAIAALEQQELASLGLNANDFRRYSRLTSGIRRKLVEFPADTHAEVSGDGSLQLQFQLPAGCYATVVLDHLFQEVDDKSQQLTADASRPSDQPE